MIQFYSKLNIYFILFVALLAIILPSSESQKTDPKIQCQGVSKASDKNELIEYDVAKKCIESFPFDAKFAKDTIDATLHFVSNYYAFLDQANEEPPKGFTYQPVNIIKELESLYNKPFKSDYDFTAALRNTIFKLKDGHTRILNICYQNFVYDQNLTLYSVVTTDKEKNKKQVFDDKSDPSNNDCEVTEIDGKPALQAIIVFANNSISYLKDLGVRFNMALAPSIGFFSQQFTLREDFPETPSITYNLTCPNKSFKFERKWAITYDSAFENFCLQDISSSSSKVTALKSTSASSSKVTPLKSRSASRNKNNKKSNIKHAKLVTEDFYLVNNGTVGVAVITEENEKSTIYALADGLDKLNKLGAKKLILDMSNNIGGDIPVAIFTILLLFRSQQQPYLFPTSIKINDFTIPAIEKKFKTHSSDFDAYNPYSYLSFPSGEPFKNASDFIGPRKNLTSSLRLDILTPNDKQLLNNTSSFPWTSEEIIIITNGFCISACALITSFLSEFHNVKTISVGGFLDTPMSFSTFPGGFATSVNVIAESAGDPKFTDLPKEINSLLLTFSKSHDFDKKSNITTGILEYLFKPADYRLYYNESNARDPSFLWIDVLIF
ncbi:1095_t:CDS:2 [Dentiscutata heterogama]|uniref:1095_t:CDS:1 n=1 Tax=Dentiscutata heterogama TaxID=1316150 RepID=A0ACA9K2Z5_9GLOM|nr:1095_t:CDS:2 [Dentiscutata heterogama]